MLRSGSADLTVLLSGVESLELKASRADPLSFRNIFSKSKRSASLDLLKFWANQLID